LPRVLLHQLDEAIALRKLCAPLSCVRSEFWSPITQFYGPQFYVPSWADTTRFASVRDYEAYVARLGALAVQISLSREWRPA